MSKALLGIPWDWAAIAGTGFVAVYFALKWIDGFAGRMWLCMGGMVISALLFCLICISAIQLFMPRSSGQFLTIFIMIPFTLVVGALLGLWVTARITRPSGSCPPATN